MLRKASLIAAAGLICIGSTSTAQTLSATTSLKPTTGNSTSGTVTFTQKGDKVVVVARVSGLKPGSHGFHIHEKGDCSAGDAMSAGDHFNPTAKPHGDPLHADHHAGDMPMLVADASGNASLTAELGPMTLGAGANDIIGKAVIVHADPDDFKTQPAGNSGGRVACGVIVKS